MTDTAADVGVIGGSGFSSFLADVEHVDVSTPFGEPSSPIALGTVGDHRVAFLARHGTRHELPPHRVNARANVWAFWSLGVQRIFGPCAAGSLRPDIHPGDFVVLDQLVDRTSGRAHTFFDGPAVHHVAFADPYCPELRTLTVAAATKEGVTAHDAGTVVVVEGPRFSTRAESQWFRRQGWHVVNMTQYPESYLAREAGACYAGVALVTDYDTGVEGEAGVEPVTQEEVFGFLETNVERVRDVLLRVLPTVPAERTQCGCAAAAGPLPGGPRR